MLYHCKKCGESMDWGCLPTVTGGIILFAEMAAIMGFTGAIVAGLFPGLAWHWLWVGPLVLVFSILAGLVFHLLLESMEWLSACLKACPSCGLRRWERRHYSGFGL